MLTLFIIFIFFIFGFITFPILFIFQRLLKLTPPDLKKTTIHIHHSFYGLLLIFIGFLVLFMLKNVSGYYIAAYGLGFIVHHEKSEPGLKGMEKFIYVRKEET